MIDRRSISQKRRAEICLRQNGLCAMCGAKLLPGKFEIDHETALVHSGSNEDDNLRALCTSPCHRSKTKKDVQAQAKVERIAWGGRQRKGPPMPGSKNTKFKKHMDGSVSWR